MNRNKRLPEFLVSKHFCGANIRMSKSRLLFTWNNVIWFLAPATSTKGLAIQFFLSACHLSLFVPFNPKDLNAIEPTAKTTKTKIYFVLEIFLLLSSQSLIFVSFFFSGKFSNFQLECSLFSSWRYSHMSVFLLNKKWKFFFQLLNSNITRFLIIFVQISELEFF